MPENKKDQQDFIEQMANAKRVVTPHVLKHHKSLDEVTRGSVELSCALYVSGSVF